MRTAGERLKKLTAFILAMALACGLFAAASAQEDWVNLSVILQGTDEAGQTYQVMAYPVTWNAQQQAFWATVPSASAEYALNVAHADHPDYVFESSAGNSIFVNAGSEMNPETAVVLTAYDANGNVADTYVLYVSTSEMPSEPVSQPLTQDITVRWALTDGTVLNEQTVTLTQDQPQVFQRLSFDGYEAEESTPESITVTLSADGSVNNSAPVFYYHVKQAEPARQDVTVRWALTDGTVLNEQTVTLIQDQPQVFQRLSFDGYEAEESTPESITVTLAADGTVNPSAPVFYYHVKQAEPARQDVTVRWALTDGTVLNEQTVTLIQDQPQVFQRLSFDGYEAEESTPESITVTLAADGTVNPSAPVFYYHVKQAEPAKQDVTVRWALTDGTVLNEQTVTLIQDQPQVFQRLNFDGYEAEESTPESITVTLAADGTVNPSAPVFYYHVKQAELKTKSVTVRWVAENGKVLQEQNVTLKEGIPQTFQQNTFEGYEADASTPVEIAAVLSSDGTVTPDDLTFYYHTTVHVPATAEVTVTYVADQSTILRTETVTVSENEPKTFARLAFDGYEPDADTPESITVSVGPDGTASPQGAVFSYHTYVRPTDVPPVTIPIHYVDAGGGALAADQYITVNAGHSVDLAPDTSLVPAEYDPASAGVITIQVSMDGIANPSEVTFEFKHREADETPIPVGELINRWAVTTAKGVHIRTEPAKKGNAGTVSKTGSKVYAVQSVQNAKGETWTKVIYEGTEGYISSEFLEVMTQAQSDDYQDTLPTAVPAVTPEVIAPTEVPATDVPATEIPTTGAPSTELPATETPAPTASPEPEAYTGYGLTLQVVALRDEVSNSDSSIMTTLPQNTLVTVKGQVYTDAGIAWSQVQTLDNLIGFVQDSTLRRINAQDADFYIRQYQEAHPTATAISKATEAPIQITGYAYTIGDNVPFRNTYSDKSVILSQLGQNTAVYVAGQVYETEDGWPWHIVMYNGTMGYIRSDMLRMMSAKEAEQYTSGTRPAPTTQVTAQPYDPNSPSSYGYIYASNNGAVNMRKTASTKAEVIKRLRNYAFCLVSGSQSIDGTNWYRVTYDGVTGYVQSNFFKQMSLAELEEFLNSREYQQGIVNNTAANTTVTAAPIISQEEQNVNTWTNPNSGLNVTYATWAPFATTPPLVTGTPEPTPTATATLFLPTASAVPSASPQAIPTVEVEPIEPERTSFGWLWILLVCLVGGSAAYIIAVRKRNQARAAERARQRKAQIARQQAAAQGAERPKTGTYPQQNATNGTVRKPYTEVPSVPQEAQRPVQTPNGQRNEYKPVFQENAKPATTTRTPSQTQDNVKQAGEFEKPVKTDVSQDHLKTTEPPTNAPAPVGTESDSSQRLGRRAARRKAMEEQKQADDQKPEI